MAIVVGLAMAPRDLSVRGCDHLHGSIVNMADGVGPRPHGGSIGRSGGGSIRIGDAVLPSPALGWGSTASALPTVPRSRRRGCGLMQLLLVAKKQIAPGETSRAFGTLEWLLFSMRSFVPFQMFQSGEGALTSRADVRPRLVGLGRREGRRRLGRVHCNGRCRFIFGGIWRGNSSRRRGIGHDCRGRE